MGPKWALHAQIHEQLRLVSLVGGTKFNQVTIMS